MPLCFGRGAARDIACISIAFSTPQLLLLRLQRTRNKIIKFLLGLVDRDLKYTEEWIRYEYVLLL